MGGVSPEVRIAQELRQLQTNTLNSLGYPFYSDGVRDRTRDLAAGEPGQSKAERLEQLLAFLREQEQAGSFLL